MATPKKKHLIELMIEAGVKWPDGAEYAAQDKRDLYVWFYNIKPERKYHDSWTPKEPGCLINGHQLTTICRNWHRTIVTLEQYSEALAANVGEPAVMPSQSNQVRESDDVPAGDAVEWHNPPSIEQLTADYHAKAAEADRMQAVADEALKAADDALLALERAGELLGLVISIDTKPKQVEQQRSSEEWKVGDKCIVTGSPDDSERVGSECVLAKIDGNDEDLPYLVDSGALGDFWVASIRRP